MVPIKVKTCDNIAVWRLIGDVVVHPDFRRWGIYRKMGEYAAEEAKQIGLNLSYRVSGNQVVIATSETCPGSPYQINNFVRIRDIDGQLRAMPMDNPWLYKLGFNALKMNNFFRNIFQEREADWRGPPVHEIASFTGQIEEFWMNISRHHNFIMVRDRGYLNWRCCDPRGGRLRGTTG